MKKLSPRKVRNDREHCQLRTDNHSVKSGWIILDGNTRSVTLCTQRLGEEPKGSPGTVTFSRADFNRLIDWYNKDQVLRND